MSRYVVDTIFTYQFSFEMTIEHVESIRTNVHWHHHIASSSMQRGTTGLLPWTLLVVMKRGSLFTPDTVLPFFIHFLMILY